MMPTWFQTVNAVILLIVTVAIACSTWQQARIAQVKLQQDFFDRRFRVYDATRHLLAEICRHGDVWLEDRRTFIIETGGAGFVFDDDDLAKFLAEVLRRVDALQTINDIEPTMPAGGELRTKAMAEKDDHVTWFNDQLLGLKDKFDPFLKFDKRQYEAGCLQAMAAFLRRAGP